MDARQRFKAIRDHFNLSMSAFGERIGLSASGVSAIEYGTRVLSEKHVKLIHAAFPEIDEEWLRTGIGKMIPDKVSEDIAIENAIRDAGSSPAIRALLVAYSRLNDQNRAVFEKFVEEYVAEYQANAAAESVARDDAVFDDPESIAKAE